MRNEIININCIDFMRQLPDESIDFVLTSPPYDTMRLYKRQVSWDFSVFKQVATQLSRIIRQGSSIVWVVGDETIDHNETGTSFRQALFFKDLGLNLYDTMIFEKANPMPGFRPSMYRQSFEYMFVFCKGQMRVFNPIMVETTTTAPTVYRKENKWSMENGKTTSGQMKRPTPAFRYHNNIFRYGVGGVKVNHPATFPLQLAKDMIFSYSNEGDTVYDPFAGSGTTNIAAYELGRACIGTEIVEDYAVEASRRLAMSMNQQKLSFSNE
jgi:site-specific DNA-methyltransferase (adenine-specific)